jgi:hypothetical protein
VAPEARAHRRCPTAGGKETNAGSFLQDDIGKDGDGVQQVLAVVEDQKRLPGGEVGDKERGWPLSRLIHQAQAGNDGLGNQMGIFESGKIDEPHAMAYGPSKVGSRAQGEPGLPYSACSHQSQQAGIGERRLHLGQ